MNEEPKPTTTASPPQPPKPAQPSPQAEAEQAALDASSAAEAIGKPKMPRRKKLMIISLVAVALLVAAAAVWYFLFRKSTPPPAPAPAVVEPAEEKVLKPSQILYAQPGSDESIQTLKRVPMLGGDSSAVAGLNSVDHVDVEKNVVAASTSKTTNGQTTFNVMVSTDGGASFSSVFQEVKPEADNAAVTSVKVSGDGSKVAFGYLPSSEGATNTIKLADVQSKKTEDLFTVQQAGSFVEGYDTSKQTVYYFEGCYFCDGNTMTKLLSRKTGQTDSTVLYDRPEALGVDLDFNADFTKAALASGVQSEEGVGPGQPYKAEEFTLADKSFKTVGSTTAEIMYAGYSNDGSSIYYTDGNKIFSVNKAGTKVLAFEAEAAVSGIGYVGEDYIVAQVGPDAKDSLVTFDIKQNKATTAVPATDNLQISGVAWE